MTNRTGSFDPRGFGDRLHHFALLARAVAHRADDDRPAGPVLEFQRRRPTACNALFPTDVVVLKILSGR